MPALDRLAANTTVDEVLHALERDGAVIIEKAISAAQVEVLGGELRPFIDDTGLIDDELVGRLTTRTGALVARSPAARQAITHPLVLDAARRFLGRFSTNIQLNLTQVMRLLPGQPAQQLHRDRYLWSQHLPATVEPMFNCMWALTDFTEQNGATRVAPGSQRWPWDRAAAPGEVIPATMPAGSVLLYTGSVIHGGGHNASDAPRIGMNITYLLAWLRQEENQYLSCPPDIARDLPVELRDLLGYTTGNGGLGYYTPPPISHGHPDLFPPEAAVSDAGAVTGDRVGEQAVF